MPAISANLAWTPPASWTEVPAHLERLALRQRLIAALTAMPWAKRVWEAWAYTSDRERADAIDLAVRVARRLHGYRGADQAWRPSPAQGRNDERPWVVVEEHAVAELAPALIGGRGLVVAEPLPSSESLFTLLGRAARNATNKAHHLAEAAMFLSLPPFDAVTGDLPFPLDERDATLIDNVGQAREANAAWAASRAAEAARHLVAAVRVIEGHGPVAVGFVHSEASLASDATRLKTVTHELSAVVVKSAEAWLGERGRPHLAIGDFAASERAPDGACAAWFALWWRRCEQRLAFVDAAMAEVS